MYDTICHYFLYERRISGVYGSAVRESGRHFFYDNLPDDISDSVSAGQKNDTDRSIGEWNENRKKSISESNSRRDRVFAVLSMALYASDNFKKLPENKSGNSMVKRNAHGKGEKNQKLIAETKDQKAKITVKIQEETYTGEELQNVFETSGKQLETLVFGENQSLDEVRNDLNLVKTIPDTGIEVTWEFSDYNVSEHSGRNSAEKAERRRHGDRTESVTCIRGRKSRAQLLCQGFSTKTG